MVAVVEKMTFKPRPGSNKKMPGKETFYYRNLDFYFQSQSPV